MSRKVSRGTRVALTTCSHPTPPNRPRQKYLSRFPGPEFAKREHWSLVRAELPLRVDVRSEAETSFLESLYGEMRRREEEHFAPDDASRPRERRCPSLHGFGLRDFATYEDLTQRLFEYEENLSPGPLRDIVHVTRLMRAVYDERDQAKKVQAVYAVMRFGMKMGTRTNSPVD